MHSATIKKYIKKYEDIIKKRHKNLYKIECIASYDKKDFYFLFKVYQKDVLIKIKKYNYDETFNQNKLIQMEMQYKSEVDIDFDSLTTEQLRALVNKMNSDKETIPKI